MAADKKKLSEIAGRWKNHDPQLYGQFVTALEQYVFDVTLAVTEASHNDILQAQGRAQQARAVFLLFTEHLEPRATSP